MPQQLPWEKNMQAARQAAGGVQQAMPFAEPAAPAEPEYEQVPLDVYDAPAAPAAPAAPKVDIDSLNPAQKEAVLTTEARCSCSREPARERRACSPSASRT